MSRIEKVHNITITRLKGSTGRALVSAYGNVDHAGDRVMPGAFTNTIAEWEASGDPCPFIWAHAWSDPYAHIGVVTKFTDTPQGLVVDFEIDTSTDFAKQVAKLLEERRVVQMSFAYDVIYERPGPDGANELVELKLLECGPCLAGMNPLTELMSRKSVQEMLAAESGQSLGWAGTSIPKRAVEDLRAKAVAAVEGFLDDVYDQEVKMKTATTDPDTARYLAQLEALDPDADLRARLSKASAPVAAVLTTAAARLEQAAVRALGVGLVSEAETLMQSARYLRGIVGGSGTDVQEVIDAVTPIVSALRTAGNAVAGDSLERTLFELAGGTGNEVTNADRVEGSVNTDIPKSYDRITAPIPETDTHLGVVRPPETQFDVGETFQIPAVDDGPVQAAIVSHRRDA